MNTFYKVKDKKEVLKLRVRGLTLRAIAEVVGIPMPTVYSWIRQEVKLNPESYKKLKPKNRRSRL